MILWFPSHALRGDLKSIRQRHKAHKEFGNCQTTWPSSTRFCCQSPQLLTFSTVFYFHSQSCEGTIPTQGQKELLAKGGPSTNTLGSVGLSHLWSGGVWAVGCDPGSGSTFLTRLLPSDDGSMSHGAILEVSGLEGLSAGSLKLFCSLALWPLCKCWQSHGMKTFPCTACVVVGSVTQTQVF